MRAAKHAPDCIRCLTTSVGTRIRDAARPAPPPAASGPRKDRSSGTRAATACIAHLHAASIKSGVQSTSADWQQGSGSTAIPSRHCWLCSWFHVHGNMARRPIFVRSWLSSALLWLQFLWYCVAFQPEIMRCEHGGFAGQHLLQGLIDGHEHRRGRGDAHEVPEHPRVQRLAAAGPQQRPDAAAGARQLQPRLDGVYRVQRCGAAGFLS